uniref:Uncharacterized protein n=1 Tax=Vitis vinifera TaxID=29760 RepID=F6I4X5_VITVI
MEKNMETSTPLILLSISRRSIKETDDYMPWSTTLPKDEEETSYLQMWVLQASIKFKICLSVHP